MKILEILKGVDLVIADIQVNLGNQKHNNPTLCVKKGDKIIPLSTPDGRPIPVSYTHLTLPTNREV